MDCTDYDTCRDVRQPWRWFYDAQHQSNCECQVRCHVSGCLTRT